MGLKSKRTAILFNMDSVRVNLILLRYAFNRIVINYFMNKY